MRVKVKTNIVILWYSLCGEPMLPYVVVMVTVANRDEALKIVRSLLKERLIACANIVGPISSIFWWKGKIEEASEFLVFMKSRENHFERLSERVMEIHSYEVPEIIAVPIIKGSQPYLEWLGDSLQK
ncbi:MAG: Divalent-cation tolerance protein CutA [Candidatus Bathyarchaeota archaeon BA2]|nr:MAG: Divalent-cation tolerance protein CutA [Candidatus Bathyarchaeota archaeon BA2]